MYPRLECPADQDAVERDRGSRPFDPSTQVVVMETRVPAHRAGVLPPCLERSGGAGAAVTLEHRRGAHIEVGLTGQGVLAEAQARRQQALDGRQMDDEVVSGAAVG